jgi:hypothetical protein
MISSTERGEINALILPLVAAIILLFGSIGFGIWAYNGKQDYKNNTDQKIAIAVTAAKQAESNAKDEQFAQESKNPLKTYDGPSAYGSVKLQYPRTWSGYVISNNTDPFINAYFDPDVVPDVNNSASTYALRLSVIGQSYSTTLTNYQQMAQQGTETVAPYSLPQVSSVVGSIITGQLVDGSTGTIVILPLRNTTLEVWTQSSTYLSDFMNIILKNLSFSP